MVRGEPAPAGSLLRRQRRRAVHPDDLVRPNSSPDSARFAAELRRGPPSKLLHRVYDVIGVQNGVCKKPEIDHRRRVAVTPFGMSGASRCFPCDEDFKPCSSRSRK